MWEDFPEGCSHLVTRGWAHIDAPHDLPGCLNLFEWRTKIPVAPATVQRSSAIFNNFKMFEVLRLPLRQDSGDATLSRPKRYGPSWPAPLFSAAPWPPLAASALDGPGADGLRTVPALSSLAALWSSLAWRGDAVGRSVEPGWRRRRGVWRAPVAWASWRGAWGITGIKPKPGDGAPTPGSFMTHPEIF